MEELAKQTGTWVSELAEEDLAFIKRFILASGSLKALAQDYGISYPTVRLRLDRLIDKIKIIEDHTISSEFERTVRVMYAEGRIDMVAVKQLLGAYQQEMEARREQE
jgi:hypothetical protein